MNEFDEEMVYHPKHYVSDSGVECIDVIRYLPHGLATAVKYVWRFRDKWDPMEDLEKAGFYLNDYEEYLFRRKDSDSLLHLQTIEAASYMMNGKVREKLRTHTLFLQEKAHPEAPFFEALYEFLQKARHGVVAYDLFSNIPLALTELKASTASLFPPIAATQVVGNQ